MVQPSINEGFGLNVAEAIAAKVPVLVSDNEGLLEIIENGKYGFSFENGNPKDFACQIESIATLHEDELNAIIERAYDKITFDFDVNKTAMRYLFFY